MKRGEKAVLISINKPHTDNIFDKYTKEIEYRKRPLPLGKHYCYETKRKGGSGKVIGEFEVYDYREYKRISDIPPIIRKLGAVDTAVLIEYAAGKPIYANFIRNVIKYDKPKELSKFWHPCPEKSVEKIFDCIAGIKSCKYKTKELPFQCTAKITRPPQSWCYVEG